MCHSALILQLHYVMLVSFFLVSLLISFIFLLIPLFHIDNNECVMGTDTCEQNCHDTVGNYTCSCNGGYTLNSDGRSCDGTYVCYLIIHVQ